MKLNEGKWHFVLSGYKHEIMFPILIGVTIDKCLKFEKHIVKQCKKAGQKLSALARVCNIQNQESRRTLIKAFIESQFGYCPLIWMLTEKLE